MTRVILTVAAPEADRDDVTHLGVCLGWLEGYRPEEWWGAFRTQWQDVDGRLYRVMSMQVQESFVQRATPNSPVERPPEYTEDEINITGAHRAQDKLVIWLPSDGGSMPPAAPDKIIAVVGPKGRDALAAMGLRPLEVEI